MYRFGNFPRIDIASSTYAIIILPGELVIALSAYAVIILPGELVILYVHTLLCVCGDHSAISLECRYNGYVKDIARKTYTNWAFLRATRTDLQHKISHVIKIFVIFPFLGNVIVGESYESYQSLRIRCMSKFEGQINYS